MRKAQGGWKTDSVLCSEGEISATMGRWQKVPDSWHSFFGCLDALKEPWVVINLLDGRSVRQKEMLELFCIAQIVALICFGMMKDSFGADCQKVLC